MVRSIQPEWVCGPVPPGDGRHGQAIETISGIYAVHVLEQQRCPKKWYESFRKIWHRGGHRRDFNKTYRGARSDDYDYYKTHYEPGRKALVHHVQALSNMDAWRRRMDQNEHVTKILKQTNEIEKHIESFRDLARHKKEQKDLQCKNEKSSMKLAGMTTIHKSAPRARDMPQFNPQRIGTRRDIIAIGIAKDPHVFHPYYTNLYKLDRYLKNIDPVKQRLLKDLRETSGPVPYELWNLVAPTPQNVSGKLEVKDIVNFEKQLDNLITQWREKEYLRPTPITKNPGNSWQSAQVEEDGSQDDHQKYGC